MAVEAAKVEVSHGAGGESREAAKSYRESRRGMDWGYDDGNSTAFHKTFETMQKLTEVI